MIVFVYGPVGYGVNRNPRARPDLEVEAERDTLFGILSEYHAENFIDKIIVTSDTGAGCVADWGIYAGVSTESWSNFSVIPIEEIDIALRLPRAPRWADHAMECNDIPIFRVDNET